MPIGLRLLPRATGVDPALVRRLSALRTTDLSDAMFRSQTMHGVATAFRPIGRVVGPALTVSAPLGGFDIVKLGVSQTEPGDVLVVTAPVGQRAIWGGNLSRGLKARGVVAFVVDGLVRDVPELTEVGLPTFARGVATAADAVEVPFGEINVPIACGGIVVHPGDLIVADEDGVVAVPAAAAADIAARAEQVVEWHAGLQEKLLRGEVTSIDKIRERLLAAGLTVDPGPAPGERGS